MTPPLSRGNNAVTQQDFTRLEDKVDQLASSIGKLILIDDRQTQQGIRIGQIEQNIANHYGSSLTLINKNFETQQKELARIEKKLDMWIQRMIGAYAVVSTGLLLWNSFGKYFTGH